MNVGRLVFPAIRWDAEHGFQNEWPAIERALELGVGGFILFGGEASSVRDLTDELTRRAPYTLLIGSDLERGAGQQFRGATSLPPAAALGWLAEPETTERAAELAAREARALGVNWLYAPVADVDLEPDNPIIGTRAFGTDPESVAEQVTAWIRGCRHGGALSCAKHFPGHGRTVGDSHIERPAVKASRQALDKDLLPFRAAVKAGVDAIMTAHVSYPALDHSGAPATLSRPILRNLLRKEMGFDGMIVTDAIIMEGLLGNSSEAEASAAAVATGCDALLYPKDPQAVVAGLKKALNSGALSEARAADAVARIERFADLVALPWPGSWGSEEDRHWALSTAVRTITALRGEPRLPDGAVRLVEIEDDLGGPYPPYPREAFPAALRRANVELREDGALLVVVYCDIRAWKGRSGLSTLACERVSKLTSQSPDATVILFSHPRLASQIPTARNLLGAWGGESLMQKAAVAWLTDVALRPGR